MKTRVAEALRTETVGGVLLLIAAVAALIWANSPWHESYRALSEFRLHLSLSAWAADGLLAIFFFVAGLELKREFVAGELRDPRRAALPVAAAVGGMALPALIYAAVNAGSGTLAGWAVPTATDIAFALAVLAVVGASLPPSLRTFLLTLAVVDDLLAIVVIAVFYTSALHLLPLLGAAVAIAAFGLVARRGPAAARWLLVPLALVAWWLTHESGIHATVAGVLLAFTVPVEQGERLEHRLRPLSAGVAVPVFAFFAAGVTVAGGGGLFDTVTVGIIAALVAGKTLGILGATWGVRRFTRAELAGDLGWWDMLGLALLGGIGFTVSLLIGELAFGAGTPLDAHAKVGVLLGSLVSAALGATVLRVRNRAASRNAPPPGAKL